MKNLICGLINSGGRNNSGKIVSFHRGGGLKRRVRLINYHRNLHPIIGCKSSVISGVVQSFSTLGGVDQNKLALIKWDVVTLGLRVLPKIQCWSYILSVEGLKVNQRIFYRRDLASLTSFCGSTELLRNRFSVGNAYPLYLLHVGSLINNIGGQYVRGVGTFGRLLEIKKDNRVLVKLPSGVCREFSGDVTATLGTIISGVRKKYCTAGRIRRSGRRPIVRGVAMNPIDHPHGGGEGKSSGGRPSVSPWGHLVFSSKKKV